MIRVQETVTRDRDRIGWLDYLLIGFGAVLACFATGMGLGEPILGWVFSGLVVVGTAFSFLLQRKLGDHWFSRWDAALYALVAVGLLFVVRDLNTLLPSNPFTARELIVASVLLWMLGLGSFFCWRDQTLVFQAVPCIAIFGLVGVWDTWQPAPFLFFGFLLSLATLFARAHVRGMLQQAEDSGFRESEVRQRVEAKGPARKNPVWIETVRRGPWRWMAGPEWALASGLVIVLLSLLGAPVLQEAAKPIAGRFRVRVNVPQQPPQVPVPPVLQQQGGETQVGRGPSNLTERPVFRFAADQKHYLRTGVFSVYTGRGWARSNSAPPPGFSALDRSTDEIRDPVTYRWRITPLLPFATRLPAPGEPTEYPPRLVRPDQDGMLMASESNTAAATSIDGASVRAENASVAKDAVRNLPPGWESLRGTQNTTRRVAELVQQATLGAKTDYEKALALKRAIETRVTYNLRAAAVPAGADVVDYFLFESREGYCDLFASAMTVMARQAGIPSRYVVGYYPMAEKMEEDGSWTVREADGHAWSELFFEGVGWVVFDATEGAPSVEGSGRGESTEQDAWYQQPLVRRTIDGLIVLLAVVGIYFAYSVLRKQVPPDQLQRTRLERAYLQFADRLARLSGRRRQLAQTPSEYLETVAPSLDGARDAAAKITRDFETAMYARPELAPEDVDLLVTQVAAFREQTKNQKPAKLSHAVVEMENRELTGKR